MFPRHRISDLSVQTHAPLQPEVRGAVLLLDYHARTQDEAFVRQVLLPLASEILTFFDRHWERDEEGVIHFDPAESLETYHQAVNPLAETAGIQSVVKRTLTLPEHLTTCRQRQDWQRLL